MANSGYDVYFDKCLFPVTPEKISIKINGNNKTVNLINEGEINILKKSVSKSMVITKRST